MNEAYLVNNAPPLETATFVRDPDQRAKLFERINNHWNKQTATLTGRFPNLQTGVSSAEPHSDTVTEE